MTLYELDNALGVLQGIEEYELVQASAGVYSLRLVSQRPDEEKLSEDATRILKALYAQEAEVSIVYRRANYSREIWEVHVIQGSLSHRIGNRAEW